MVLLICARDLDRAARIARAAADGARRPSAPASCSAPWARHADHHGDGNVTFDEVRDGYESRRRGLIAGGADALMLETCQDTLNVKAAAIGVRRALHEAGVDLPFMVSGTIEPMGTMLAGREWTRSTPRWSTSTSSRSGSTAPPAPSS
jgi:5-methyltetrahydrofolate--homocysteine methyltransferase